MAELLEAMAALSTMPHRFPLVDPNRHPDMRRRVVGSYRIFYRPIGTRIYILHVLHAARDHDSLLDVAPIDR